MNIQIPRMIGFGIQTRKDFEKAGQLGDGAIIGSQFIQLISENLLTINKDINTTMTKFVTDLRSV